MQKLILVDGGHLLDLTENLKLNSILTDPWESSWNIPMRIIPNGDFSELVIVLTKPSQLTDFQFDDRVEKINELVFSMKTLLASKS